MGLKKRIGLLRSFVLGRKIMKTEPGSPLPFGATFKNGGINFSLFSDSATQVNLIIISNGEQKEYSLLRSGDVWHIFISGLTLPCRYGYKLMIEGFESQTIVADPYAKEIDAPKSWGEEFSKERLGILSEPKAFDWGEDRFPDIPPEDLIIYEMHVRGFTNDDSSNVAAKGTYKGLIEKIPYLKSLGINAIELLPVYEFDEKENPRIDPVTNSRLYQYWGYSPLNFFSPMRRYALEDPINEFKVLVKECHANGIEVILDVVYNHTSEGGKDGPTLSFKGISPKTYYLIDENGEFLNFSGCGNTFNTNHPVSIELIISSLRYWVTEMHVDGFRFDLASILTRSPEGEPMVRPPIVEACAKDPLLSKRKLIAEAWDAAGLYQVGSFPTFQRWKEWNGKYRDTVRRFLKGTDGEIGYFATRLSGSQDLYGKDESPLYGINFVVAHDGFTLRDLVSYNEKHNIENGEDNRDGTNDNESWNCGVEGDSEDPKILSLRKRQMKNFHLALMLSQGIPMLHMGDEYGHSRKGNNNGWAVDSPLNWFLWNELEKNADFFNFYKNVIAFRKAHRILSMPRFLTDHDVKWHGKIPLHPDWGLKSRLIAFTLFDQASDFTLYAAFNAGAQNQLLHLPHLPAKKKWKLIVDTSHEESFVESKIGKDSYDLPAHSALLLKS